MIFNQIYPNLKITLSEKKLLTVELQLAKYEQAHFMKLAYELILQHHNFQEVFKTIIDQQLPNVTE